MIAVRFSQALVSVLFPASLLAVGAVGIGWTLAYDLSPWLLVVLGLLLAFCVPLSLRLQKEMRRTCEAEALRERVRALEEQEHISAAYRERILADEEGIRAVRRRVAEEVTEARAMISARDADAASQRLARALELMGDGAYRQCDHPSADAMASMKAQACRDAGVEPRFALEVPRDVPVSAVDLCAVLGNLADNGLAAAVRVREEGMEPYLRLRCAAKDGYLVVTAQNPVGKADAEVLRANRAGRLRKGGALPSVDSHGWGLSIVSSIAARYDGALAVEVFDGVFKATVALRLDGCAEGKAQ